MLSTLLTIYVKSCAHPPAAESSAKTTEEEHVSLDEIMHEATLIGATMTEQSTVDHRSSPSAPVELPLRPLHVTSTLPPTTLAIADHSEEWDEQDEYEEEEEEQFAFNYAMGLPIFDTRATDIAKLLGAYDPLEDQHDDEELFGGPLEAFHSSFYEMVGLNANGEETVESDDEEVDSSGDEFDSDEDEDVDDRSEYGDEEIDRSSFIGDDEEQEEWNEHEYSDAELDAEGGVSVSGDEETEETELEGEDERKRKDLYD